MKICLFSLLILTAYPLFGQEPSAKRIRQNINKLASVKMQGRGTGSTENTKAARYAIYQLKINPLA